MHSVSIDPDGNEYQIPVESEHLNELKKLKNIITKQRKTGKKIIVVQGLGFVGAVMAAVVADCKVHDTIPYFVIGVDLPNANSFWKIAVINSGKSPFKAKDPELGRIFERTVIRKKNLLATWMPEVYSEADIVIVSVNLDVIKTEIGRAEKAEVEIKSFKQAINIVGKKIKANTLLLIETTVPPGTIEKIVKPSIEKCFIERGIDLLKNPPLIAHSYERVMPGNNYVNSIKNMWRTFSSTNKEASRKTREFLSNFIDTKQYPLWELRSTTDSELAKVLENSYRAMNIAIIYEWTLLAEDIGVNLFEVINSIKVRKGTHDNMMYPGIGVGGYCLTKDPLMAEWASKNIFKREAHLGFSVEAVNVNDLMPHHTFDLLMKGMNNNIHGKKITILGASYRKDVDDTRNSPTIILYDDIKKAGGYPELHDPYAKIILQRPDIKINSDIDSLLEDASAIIFVVQHQEYEELTMEKVISKVRKKGCIVDAFDVLSDKKIIMLKKHGFKVFGVGKGHIKYLLN
jgi:UDP-N-acetyl-D-glucosamine dehydrogenase